MLKIKRERLDELEKFGFVKDEYTPNYFKAVSVEREDEEDVYISVSYLDCYLHLGSYDVAFCPNVIYDLIEAGMVEKEDE